MFFLITSAHKFQVPSPDTENGRLPGALPSLITTGLLWGLVRSILSRLGPMARSLSCYCGIERDQLAWNAITWIRYLWSLVCNSAYGTSHGGRTVTLCRPVSRIQYLLLTPSHHLQYILYNLRVGSGERSDKRSNVLTRPSNLKEHMLLLLQHFELGLFNPRNST